MCWLDSVAKADGGKAVDATAAPGGKSAAGREAARTGRIRLLIDDDAKASWEGQRLVNRMNAGTKYFIILAHRSDQIGLSLPSPPRLRVWYAHRVGCKDSAVAMKAV